MSWIGKSIDSIKSIKMRQLLTNFKILGASLVFVLIIWKMLIFVSGSESPGIIVTTGSMEPGFKRGDVMLLHMNKKPIRVGEIVVFRVNGVDIPIVHRVIKVHKKRDTGEEYILTKGDNNLVDDSRFLYPKGQLWLHRDQIIGKVSWFFPQAGWFKIIITDYSIIKYIFMGAMGLFMILSKD